MHDSREIFNKWQAQRWWAENYEKVMELYNVQRFNQQTPLPTTPKSEDEVRDPCDVTNLSCYSYDLQNAF
jgi:RNase P/RNase MRP subunit p30